MLVGGGGASFMDVRSVRGGSWVEHRWICVWFWLVPGRQYSCLSPLAGWGGVGGGKAWWVLVGVGDEARCWVLKDHTVGVPGLVGGVVWFLWWSAPGPQTVVVLPLPVVVVVGVWWWVWVVGVVLLVC